MYTAVYAGSASAAAVDADAEADASHAEEIILPRYLYRHSKQEKSRQESLIHLVGIYHTKMVRLVLPCMYHTFSTESQFYCGNISAKFLGFFVCTSLQ